MRVCIALEAAATYGNGLESACGVVGSCAVSKTIVRGCVSLQAPLLLMGPEEAAIYGEDAAAAMGGAGADGPAAKRQRLDGGQGDAQVGQRLCTVARCSGLPAVCWPWKQLQRAGRLAVRAGLVDASTGFVLLVTGPSYSDLCAQAPAFTIGSAQAVRHRLAHGLTHASSSFWPLSKRCGLV